MFPAIPFNKPFVAGKELEYIAQAVTYGRLAGDGVFTEACTRLLEEKFGSARVLLTPSCTAALEMAALLCNLAPGDEVIVPSFTFVSTASAFVRLGARPRFVDIRPDTLNLNERLVQKAITPRTRAIFAVHYAGVGCEMDALMALAERHHLSVVEDAAQGVNAFYKGRALGSIGHLGAYSFHETKNYTCGEGGALCINRPEFIERAEILRDKGTNRKQFFRGLADRYTWVEVGSSYVPSELAAAFLFGQLELLEKIGAHRRRLGAYYRTHLQPLADDDLVVLPHVPATCVANDHMFYLLLPSLAVRDALLTHLRQQGILAVFHYVPLHTSPVGQSFGYREGDLPITEDVSGRLLRLPLYYDMTEAEQARVVEQVGSFLRQHAVAIARQQRARALEAPVAPAGRARRPLAGAAAAALHRRSA
jgi:dTDP-4-amino-4,6-dideoxygalactose transaminase